VQTVSCGEATLSQQEKNSSVAIGEEHSADKHTKLPASSAQRQDIPLKKIPFKSWNLAVTDIFTRPRRGLDAP
jgi:hypothetical protein